MASSASEIITVQHSADGVAVITMTNAAINNFGSYEALDKLAAAMKDVRKAGARVVVLASGLSQHWMEHAWLPDLRASFTGGTTTGTGGGWHRALAEMKNHGVIYIAAINGDCSGGGAELAWACDLRVAETQANISQPEVMINLATGIGGTCRLMRLIGPTATAEMVLDGAPFSARRLYELGGLNRVVEQGEACAYACSWAQRLASRPPDSLRVLKQMLVDAQEMHLSQAMENEQKLFQTVARTPAAIEGINAVQRRFDSGDKPRDVYGRPRL